MACCQLSFRRTRITGSWPECRRHACHPHHRSASARDYPTERGRRAFRNRGAETSGAAGGPRRDRPDAIVNAGNRRVPKNGSSATTLDLGRRNGRIGTRFDNKGHRPEYSAVAKRSLERAHIYSSTRRTMKVPDTRTCCCISSRAAAALPLRIASTIRWCPAAAVSSSCASSSIFNCN